MIQRKMNRVYMCMLKCVAWRYIYACVCVHVCEKGYDHNDLCVCVCTFHDDTCLCVHMMIKMICANVIMTHVHVCVCVYI
jgi:hypothetical protein